MSVFRQPSQPPVPARRRDGLVRGMVFAAWWVLPFFFSITGCRRGPDYDRFFMQQRSCPPPSSTPSGPSSAANGHAPGSPSGRTAAPIVWHCDPAGLHPDLLAALRVVASCYHARTGHPIVINSGRRTLRHQARLMAGMTRKQLEGMYCRSGYPSYIRAIITARENHNGPLSAEETYDILRRRTEGYISTHLFGAAVDLSPEGMDVDLLRSLLRDHGFAVLDERSLGVCCLHATYRSVPKQIIRE